MATSNQQAKRNRAILVAKAKGRTTAEIARQTGLTTARVRQIVAAGTVDLVDAFETDPVQLAFERRAQFEEIYEHARALMLAIPDDNPSPKVGSIRATQAALDALVIWDQFIGLLPLSAGALWSEIDVRHFVELLFQATDEFKVDEEFMKRVSELSNSAERGAITHRRGSTDKLSSGGDTPPS